MKLKSETNLYYRGKYLNKIRGFYHETEIIKVITGVRRCGKSSLMQMVISELLEAGIDNSNIIYLNLDTRFYLNTNTAEKLDNLIAEKTKVLGTKYLFIDEIQNIKNFEPVINAWREEGDISIFITGSNSYLLSGELATKLTGRYIQVDMLPLTFDEYIGMKKFLNIPIKDDLDELINFVYDGGFPYTLKLITTEAKKQYIEDLIDEIFKKDIWSRINIRNKFAFEAVMNYFISNFGSPTNLTNVVKDLNDKGLKIKIETANRYIEALEKAKILICCNRFDVKSRRALMGEKKYYLADLSFYFATRTDNKINYGPVLENIIHNYALTNGYSVSVGKVGNFECDFILRSKANDYAYVQVAYTILASKETEEREYRPLEKIKWDNYPKYVMTTDELIQKRNGIIHANIMDFIKNRLVWTS